MARLLVLALGVPEVRTQFPLRLGTGRVVWADLIVGNHVVEFDGKAKYLRSVGETDQLTAGEIVWEEKERQRLICAEDLGVSRLIWADFWGLARDEARRRLTSELAITRARFGDRRPPRLDDFAVKMAEARRRRLRPDLRGGVVG